MKHFPMKKAKDTCKIASLISDMFSNAKGKQRGSDNMLFDAKGRITCKRQDKVEIVYISCKRHKLLTKVK